MKNERSLASMKGVDSMKKEWSCPSLEVLDVNMTMGPGVIFPDDPNTPIDPFGS